MPQDAYTLNSVITELDALLTGGKISKINMPERDELAIIIYTRRGSVKLEISASPKNNRISLGNDEKPNPKVAPNFCMLLRKHLQNAEILKISQVGFERIARFDLKCFSEFSISEMSLYCEIMGKYSNVILVENGIILGAMKQTALEENVKRVTLTGARYTLPAPQDKANPKDLAALKSAFENKAGDAAKFISSACAGIAYSTALDMVEVYGEEIDAEQVYEYVNGGIISPCVTLSPGGVPADFKVRCADAGAKRYDSVLEAQTEYYSSVYRIKTFEEAKRKLTGALASSLKKAEKRLGQIESKLAECVEADDLKLKGELITANIYRVQRGDRYLTAVNYYDENCPEIKIALDVQLTPAQNAQKYYKKYAKLKRTYAVLTEQKDETVTRLDYLNSIKSNICAAESLSDLNETEEELTALGLLKVTEKKKKVDRAAPLRQFEFLGFKVFSGANNAQNDRLLKILSPEDMWLHTRKFHSSHVGIITDGRQVPDEVLLAAAEVCAYYSEARDNDKVPVDYTQKKYVKKPPKAAIGFVTYTDYKTIIVAPDAHKKERNEQE
ncbi:MAG: NFACT family protein [Candidatus Coproplasma sp.]